MSKMTKEKLDIVKCKLHRISTLLGIIGGDAANLLRLARDESLGDWNFGLIGDAESLCYSAAHLMNIDREESELDALLPPEEKADQCVK